jgi:hypothetical protein
MLRTQLLVNRELTARAESPRSICSNRNVAHQSLYQIHKAPVFPSPDFVLDSWLWLGCSFFINFGVNLEDPTGCRSWRPWHTARTMVMFLLTEGLASGRMAAGLVRTLLPHMHPSHATLRPHRIPSHVPVPASHPMPPVPHVPSHASVCIRTQQT